MNIIFHILEKSSGIVGPRTGVEGQVSKTAMKKMEEACVRETTLSLPPAKCVGTYENELYGEIGITHKDGMLVLHVSPAATGDLENCEIGAGPSLVLAGSKVLGSPIRFDVSSLPVYDCLRCDSNQAR